MLILCGEVELLQAYGRDLIEQTLSEKYPCIVSREKFIHLNESDVSFIWSLELNSLRVWFKSVSTIIIATALSSVFTRGCDLEFMRNCS